MKTFAHLSAPALVFCVSVSLWAAQEPTARTPSEIFAATFTKVANLVEPAAGSTPQTFSARLQIARGEGLPKKLAGVSAQVAYQAPDRFLLSAEADGKTYALGRDQQHLWIHAPNKSFGVVGSPGVPRFASAPDKLDSTKLDPIKLPLPKEQLAILPLLFNVEALPAETLDNVRCHVLKAVPKPEAIDILKLPNGQLKLWVRETDSWPARIGYHDGKNLHVEVQLRDVTLGEPWPDDRWTPRPQPGNKLETAALSHLKRFLSVALSSLNQKIPSLGPVTGERRVLATEGEGRLEMIEGTRLLFLKGSPEEMGRQHGILMKKQVRDVVNRILYGVGVGSSFAKGKWFFGEIEQAQARLAPYLDQRYLQEMDSIALATGLEKEEVRLANFFPELFHCSGFALFGDATKDGRLFHGRILDYMKGVGLEQNAVVMVFQPDSGNAWVNISYAGFVGSVTAMNEKRVAIGEMGGRGEGHWDGKPMAQLIREVMEKANTIEEAVEIMRKGPRTCEYYYVISDGKTKRAVGIAATPTKFETVWAGQSHPQLPHAIKDAVLMSAGDRYEKLVERVRQGYGRFDPESARGLMKRPVCMNSNIHSVLFEPDTLDFWVANADAKEVASHTRFTRYNLAELLKGPPSVASSKETKGASKAD